MEKTAIVTDSNSGMTAEDAARYDIHIVPMPVLINGKEYFVPMATEEPSVVAAASNASK